MHGFQSGLSDIVLRALFSCPIKYHSIASTSKYYLPNDSWRLEWCDYSMQRSPWRSSLITLTSVIDRFLENLPFHHRSTLSELSTFISLGCLLLTPYWSAIFPLDYLPFLLPSSVNLRSSPGRSMAEWPFPIVSQRLKYYDQFDINQARINFVDSIALWLLCKLES